MTARTRLPRWRVAALLALGALAALRRSLKPGGRMVLVEFRAEDPDVPIQPEHKMSKQQIIQEIPPNGFALVQEYDELPWQHVMIFTRER